MRIAVTAQGLAPGSSVDGRFSVAPYTLIFDTETGKWQRLENPFWPRAKDAPGLRPRRLKEERVEALITAGVDPVSFRELSVAGIRISSAPPGTAAEAVDLLLEGRLAAMHIPDAVDVKKLVRKKAPINVRESGRNGFMR